jgi:hypothetical protein
MDVDAPNDGSANASASATVGLGFTFGDGDAGPVRSSTYDGCGREEVSSKSIDTRRGLFE